MAESKPRHRRIEGEMQRVLSELVSREVKDPRVGSVTITEVKVAADMSTARIFFTPFASKHSPEEVQEGLTQRRRLPARRSGAAAAACGTRRGSSSCSTTRSRRPRSSPR